MSRGRLDSSANAETRRRSPWPGGSRRTSSVRSVRSTTEEFAATTRSSVSITTRYLFQNHDEER